MTAIVVALGGCGSSARQARRVDVHAISAATDSAGTARFETTFVTWFQNDGSPPQSSTSKMLGTMDFAHDEGDAKGEPDPTPTTTPADAAPFDESKQEQRWIGSVVYMTPNLFAAAPDPRVWGSYDTARLYAALDACDRKYVGSVSALSFVGPSSSDPSRILSDLAAAGDSLTNAGTADVRGVATTRWSVGLPAVSCRTPAPKLPQVDLFVDDQQRLRRLTTRSPAPGTKLPPTTITTDLFDFGVAVQVDAPPAAQVMDLNGFMTSLYRGPGKIDAAWRVVAQNTVGAPFKVWYAHTSTGLRCFDLEPNPDPLPASDDGTDGTPHHDGHESQCTFDGAPPSQGLSGFVARTAGAEEQIVVAIAAGYTNARLVHDDGSTSAVPIDPVTGLVNWTGPATPTVTGVRADGPLGRAQCATEAAMPIPDPAGGPNSFSGPALCDIGD